MKRETEKLLIEAFVSIVSLFSFGLYRCPFPSTKSKILNKKTILQDKAIQFLGDWCDGGARQHFMVWNLRDRRIAHKMWKLQTISRVYVICYHRLRKAHWWMTDISVRSRASQSLRMNMTHSYFCDFYGTIIVKMPLQLRIHTRIIDVVDVRHDYSWTMFHQLFTSWPTKSIDNIVVSNIKN